MKWGTLFDLDSKRTRILELEEITFKSDFWQSENSKVVLQELNKLKNDVESYEKLKEKVDDTEILIELAISENDESLFDEIDSEINTIVKSYENKKIENLFSGEFDSHNVLVTLHAGAGGTDSCDWNSMLYRMYLRWCQNHKYKVKEISCISGDEAGIKSVSFTVEGFNAYGYFKSEKGVHRLVRISPFNSAGKRHTSFAALDITPIFEDDNELEINQEDLKIDTYRASGAGGQHVNTTDSAVRITHLPTGLVVQCQNERSQHKNKDFAMKMLKSKLLEIEKRENLEKIDEIRGDLMDNGFGSQIRSYVFHPYTIVKDHRTNEEEHNITAVMDGEIDKFIEAYLIKENNERNKN